MSWWKSFSESGWIRIPENANSHIFGKSEVWILGIRFRVCENPTRWFSSKPGRTPIRTVSRERLASPAWFRPRSMPRASGNFRGAAGWLIQPSSGNGKTRKRSAAKAATGQVAAKVKATIHLSGEADKRLSVHATMMEMDRSELVEFLIVTPFPAVRRQRPRRRGRQR